MILSTLLPALLACAAAPQTSGRFTALTYNVKSLPSEIAGYDTDVSTALIGPRLADFEIVGLQEDFDEARHAVMTEAAGQPTQRWFSDTVDSDRAYGSGLSLLSDYPELDHYQEHFEDCYGTLDHGSDCLASKGFLAVRLELGAGSVDVYDTHLDAGGSEGDSEARITQVSQIVAAMNGWSAGRALILLGDTNLDPSQAAELAVIEDWMAQAGLSDTCAAVDCPEPEHIDRILTRDGGGLRFGVEDWSNQDAAFQDAAGLPLSDHAPLSVTLSWSIE